MKFNQTLTNFVSTIIENNNIPMLLGEPGIGKSSWVESLAEEMHTKCFTLACNQLADKADLTGARLVPTSDNQEDWKQVFYPHAVISDAIAYAIENPRETPILFLDEANRTTPDVTSELLSIPTLRSIGNKELPDNLKVIMAGNDKGNVTALDTASISRFVLFHVEPDVNTFLNLDPNLNIMVRNTLTKYPNSLFSFSEMFEVATGDHDDEDSEHDDLYIEDIIDGGDEMRQMTTPRTVSAVSKFLNSLTDEDITKSLSDIVTIEGREISILQEVIEGFCGYTSFTKNLMLEISNTLLTNGNTNSAGTKVGKPAVYDDMKASKDMTELNEFIENMTDRDKSGSLIYALQEKVDNSTYISALAHSIDKLVDGDITTFQALNVENKLDKENLQVFLESGSNLSENLSILF